MYTIEIKNPERVCKGVKEVIVNGKAIDENIIPIFKAGSINQVEVVMG